MHRAGSCPALQGDCLGSVPKQKESFFRCIPACIFSGAWGQGEGSHQEAFSVHSSWAVVGGLGPGEGDH